MQRSLTVVTCEAFRASARCPVSFARLRCHLYTRRLCSYILCIQGEYWPDPRGPYVLCISVLSFVLMEIRQLPWSCSVGLINVLWRHINFRPGVCDLSSSSNFDCPKKCQDLILVYMYYRCRWVALLGSFLTREFDEAECLPTGRSSTTSEQSVHPDTLPRTSHAYPTGRDRAAPEDQPVHPPLTSTRDAPRPATMHPPCTTAAAHRH